MRRPALALAVLLALAPPAAARGEGSLGVRLVGEDGPYLDVRLGPGERVAASVEVSSTAAAPLDVELYAAAATGRGEAFDFADDRTANDLSGWTTVTPSSTTLAPGAAARVDVVVAVPEDVAPGPRSAVVWAQVGDQASGGVVQVRRVGVRLHVDVVRPSLRGPGLVAGSLLLLAAAAGVAARRRSG